MFALDRYVQGEGDGHEADTRNLGLSIIATAVELLWFCNILLSKLGYTTITCNTNTDFHFYERTREKHLSDSSICHYPYTMVLRTTIARSRLGKRLVHGFELPFWVRLFCARDGWVSDQKVHSENYIMRTPCECVSYLHSKNFIPILRCVSCPAVTYLLALSYSITMEDTKQKIYRPWPSGPPTYQQTTDDQTRDVTQNRDWNYSLFECFSPGSLCGLTTLSWLYVLTSVTDSI